MEGGDEEVVEGLVHLMETLHHLGSGRLHEVWVQTVDKGRIGLPPHVHPMVLEPHVIESERQAGVDSG